LLVAIVVNSCVVIALFFSLFLFGSTKIDMKFNCANFLRKKMKLFF
jgi:hypothetical protein